MRLCKMAWGHGQAGDRELWSPRDHGEGGSRLKRGGGPRAAQEVGALVRIEQGCREALCGGPNALFVRGLSTHSFP